MRIIPVLDLLNGIVVRGVAGERDRYRPVESVLTDSAEPLVVAAALRDAYGFEELYVADLDGILNRRPNLDVVRNLREAGFRCHVDAGVRSLTDARMLVESGSESVIVCLETEPKRVLLQRLLAAFGAERLIFSLDLKSGRPQGSLDGVGQNDALNIARRVREYGFRRLIVLDLAAVGVDGGPATIELCGRLRRDPANLEIITGGGVRSLADLDDLEAAGVDAVLMASALHAAKFTRDSLRAYEQRSRPERGI